MSLQLTGYIDLPAHVKTGGFDHAAVHRGLGRLYVAHTANDALDVIDCRTDSYLHSIPILTGVAGTLVSEASNLVFTSNRGENTVGIFSPEDESGLVKIPVGIRPNGLSYDAGRGLLLSAHVGDPAVAGSTSVALIDVAEKRVMATIPVPGRTRWTIFDATTDSFYVNISDPSVIVVIDAKKPSQIARTLAVPGIGPHGLDMDSETGRLLCACDGKKLICLEAQTGNILSEAELSGAPDVIFYNAGLHHLYVAIGDPGMIDVFDTRDALHKVETITTEPGAHTIAFDASSNKVYGFLPETHRAAVFLDD